jgi:hypothetical protein
VNTSGFDESALSLGDRVNCTGAEVDNHGLRDDLRDNVDEANGPVV